jgi:hypothetical protein
MLETRGLKALNSRICPSLTVILSPEIVDSFLKSFSLAVKMSLNPVSDWVGPVFGTTMLIVHNSRKEGLSVRICREALTEETKSKFELKIHIFFLF